jgi:hypothetical protein
LESALKSNKSSVIRKQLLGYNGTSGVYDILLTPLSQSKLPPGVMLLFEKTHGSLEEKRASVRRDAPAKVKGK